MRAGTANPESTAIEKCESAILGFLYVSIAASVNCGCNKNRFHPTLRKLIAIALLAVFGLPSAPSLFAVTTRSESSTPACCRRTGKHHCMMSMAERSGLLSDQSGFSAPLERCPYNPPALLSIHHSVGFVPPSGHAIYAGLVSHPSGVVQTECKRRISLDRARGKRGPPVSLL